MLDSIRVELVSNLLLLGGKPSTGKNWAFQMHYSGEIALGTFGSGGAKKFIKVIYFKLDACISIVFW